MAAAENGIAKLFACLPLINFAMAAIDIKFCWNVNGEIGGCTLCSALPISILLSAAAGRRQPVDFGPSAKTIFFFFSDHHCMHQSVCLIFVHKISTFQLSSQISTNIVVTNKPIDHCLHCCTVFPFGLPALFAQGICLKNFWKKHDLLLLKMNCRNLKSLWILEL